MATDPFKLLRETIGKEAGTACRFTCHGDESVPEIARRQHAGSLTQTSCTPPAVSHRDYGGELDVLSSE